MTRQPILSILGHVDSGKTTLLDNIRESRIVEGEDGGITQMIGATEIPLDTVEKTCGPLLEQLDADITLPGFLFIDTPGHAAFSSLRKRGGNIADIAILVIDIQEGVQPQTKEALQLLQESGTPFIVALNKIDLMPGWKSEDEMFSKNIKNQSDKIKGKLDERIYEIMGELHEEVEVSAERFDRVDNFQKKVAIVPISAESGEGIPELLMTLTGLSQNYLSDQLEVDKESTGKGTILEVTEEKGLGTTIDVIHYDGTLKKTDKLVYGTRNGAKTTNIRALLKPRPLKEIRLDKQFNESEEVEPASGIKISGQDLEGAVAGAPIRATSQENLETAVKEVEEELDSSNFQTQNEGVVVKADSLGSLEALMNEIKEHETEIPVQKAEVGQIRKSDVVEVENEELKNQAILSFNTTPTKQAQQLIQDKNIQHFHETIIYQILEEYTEWKTELEKKQRENALNKVPRPAKIRLMPEHVFNKSKPAVVGVKIEQGVLTDDTPFMTPQGEEIGKIKSVQNDGEKVEKALKGEEVAASITNATIGRNLDKNATLYTNPNKKQYRQLQQLEDLLNQDEKTLLEEIVKIKDEIDPHWKI